MSSSRKIQVFTVEEIYTKFLHQTQGGVPFIVTNDYGSVLVGPLKHGDTDNAVFSDLGPPPSPSLDGLPAPVFEQPVPGPAYIPHAQNPSVVGFNNAPGVLAGGPGEVAPVRPPIQSEPPPSSRPMTIADLLNPVKSPVRAAATAPPRESRRSKRGMPNDFAHLLNEQSSPAKRRYSTPRSLDQRAEAAEPPTFAGPAGVEETSLPTYNTSEIPPYSDVARKGAERHKADPETRVRQIRELEKVQKKGDNEMERTVNETERDHDPPPPDYGYRHGGLDTVADGDKADGDEAEDDEMHVTWTAADETSSTVAWDGSRSSETADSETLDGETES
ncbi:hypothetical protein QBC39DRAFT_434203 [Podospora conica]|nr:hypothetical protein QBC39DRAFT_434203 [Schizothecium conicum]